MKHSLVLVLALLTLALVPVAGAGAPAAAPRETAQVVSRTLPNGLQVLVWPRKTAPVVTTQLWYRVGSKDELPGATGLAHFLEHLLFKGTKKLKKGEIDRLTYRHGGSNNAFTFNDYTTYEFNFPKTSWTTALAIEADRMRNCVFDKAEFEAEREVVMEERRGQQDDPGSRFGEQLNTLLFTAHPYRNPIIGWMEDLKRVTRDEVYAFYRKYYVPANATLVITGDITPEEAVAAARAAFAAVPKLPTPPRRAVLEPERVDGARHLRSFLSTRVPRLSVGFQVPKNGHPDLYPLWILDYLLSEGNLSRLHRRLVDQDATAADAGSYFGSFREGGELVLEASAREGAAPERMEAAVWDELDRLASDPVPAAELERAKNQFYSQWVHGMETANELANLLGEANSTGSYRDLDRTVPAMLQVTAEDIRRVVRTYLRRERAVIGYLYPKDEGGKATVARRHPGTGRAGRGAGARTSGAAAPNAGRPAPSTTAFALLTPVEKTLPNGLKLILLENHDLPSITFSARIEAGSYRDPDGKAGLAGLTARMLDQGTAGSSYEQIQAALEQVGAAFSASPGKEATSAELRSLSRYAYDLLPLFANLLSQPAFPPERVELERGKLLTELKESEDDAEYVARRAFNELTFGAHPGGRPMSGTLESVAAVGRADVAAFHERYFTPDATVLAVVGDFRSPEMLERLTSVFSAWQPGRKRAEPLPAVERQSDTRTRRLTLPDKTQTQVLLGHLGIRRADPDYLALKVMDTILGEGVGGGFTARIPYQLRDVQGLAYSVGSSITASAGREPGVFIAAMGTAPEKEKGAVAGLLKEIERIRSRQVSEAELSEAVNYLVNSYVFDFQTHEQLAHYLVAVDWFGLGYDYRRRFVTQVRKVNRGAILRAARKHLDPAHHTLVIVAPGGP